MKLKTRVRFSSLILAFVFFGVYSVPLCAVAYPLTKAPSSSSSFQSTPSKNTDSGNDSRFSKESSKQAISYPTERSTPFSPGSHNFALSVGQIFLMGDLAGRYENAIGTEIHYTYGVSELFSFESNFGYSSHSGQVSGASMSLAHLAAGIRTNLVYFDQLIPYFTAGLGFYDMSETRSINGIANGATYDVGGLLFGLQMGGGAELILSSRIFFGAGLTYNNLFSATKTASNGNLVGMGGSLISFLVHVGMSF